MFAALDTFSFVMIFPFLETLFGAVPSTSSAPASRSAGCWSNTIGRLMPAGAEPMQAITVLSIAVFAVFMLKNVFDYLQQVLVPCCWSSRSRATCATRSTSTCWSWTCASTAGRGRPDHQPPDQRHDLLRTLVTKNIATFVTSVLQVMFAVTCCVFISWQLTLLALVVMPLTFVIWRRLLAPLRRGDRRVLDWAAR
jgi:hypothetical protein